MHAFTCFSLNMNSFFSCAQVPPNETARAFKAASMHRNLGTQKLPADK